MRRRWGFLGLGVTLLLVFSLSGCIYFRLLDFKRQLTNFEKNFHVEDQRGGLWLLCRHPVLLDQDILWLLKSAPTFHTQKASAQKESWTYRFQKEEPPAPSSPKSKREKQGRYDLDFQMLFHQGKLTGIYFPPRLLTFFPKAYILTTLKAFGSASVNRRERRAHVESLIKASELNLPDKNQLQKLLGKPYAARRIGSGKEGLSQLTYRYFLLSSASLENSRIHRKKAEGQFFFDRLQKLIRWHVSVSGLSADIDLLKRPNLPKKNDQGY